MKKEILTFLNKLYTAAFSNCYVSLSMARDEASPESIQWKTKQLEVSSSGFLTENIFFTEYGSVLLRIIPNKNRQPLVRDNWTAVFKLRLLYYWLYLFHNCVTSFTATKTNKDLSVLMEHFRPFWLENYTGLLLLCKMESENSKLRALHLLMPYKKRKAVVRKQGRVKHHLCLQRSRWKPFSQMGVRVPKLNEPGNHVLWMPLG